MDGRELILQADSIARGKQMSQAKWSTKAGYAKNGQTVSRIMSSGDCRLSTFVCLLDAIGCELVIQEKKSV